jgi:hypothetical protein
VRLLFQVTLRFDTLRENLQLVLVCGRGPASEVGRLSQATMAPGTSTASGVFVERRVGRELTGTGPTRNGLRSSQLVVNNKLDHAL